MEASAPIGAWEVRQTDQPPIRPTDGHEGSKGRLASNNMNNILGGDLDDFIINQ